MSKAFPLMLAVAVLAAAGGYFAAKKFAPEQPGRQEATTAGFQELLGQKRPDFSHLDSAGEPVSAADHDGKVLLLNFWASWCVPCVEEMPMLSRLQEAYSAQGLRVLGIALDDPERATAFAKEMALSYPVLVGGADVVVTGRRYGNSSGMLPFSVLIDREGVIRWTHLGLLESEKLEQQIQTILRSD